MDYLIINGSTHFLNNPQYFYWKLSMSLNFFWAKRRTTGSLLADRCFSLSLLPQRDSTLWTYLLSTLFVLTKNFIKNTFIVAVIYTVPMKLMTTLLNLLQHIILMTLLSFSLTILMFPKLQFWFLPLSNGLSSLLPMTTFAMT